MSKPKEIINKKKFQILVLWNTEYKISMSIMLIEIKEMKYEQKKKKDDLKFVELIRPQIDWKMDLKKSPRIF